MLVWEGGRKKVYEGPNSNVSFGNARLAIVLFMCVLFCDISCIQKIDKSKYAVPSLPIW